MTELATVYLLAEKPSVYGFPENPQAKLSQVIWKDYAQPLGKMMIGATTIGVLECYGRTRCIKTEE